MTSRRATHTDIDSCDIFCTVIDNYGDIGVSWRLARQFADEYGLAVRLWVDDLAALQRICPQVAIGAAQQQIGAVSVLHWRQPFVADEAAINSVGLEPAAVVIEAFGCELPAVYIRALAQRSPPTVWINLEYLSAESWVADCHGLPSPQTAAAVPKYFFFPGFSAGTGGLLREHELLAQRHAFQADPQTRTKFLARFGLQIESSALAVSLFAYENNALPQLLAAWTDAAKPVWCLVPEGKSVAAIEQFFDVPRLAAGALCRRGSLTVAVLPFLAQDDYDRLLWSCDLNFVRGEDSFVRAQWAGRPLLWHIYPQQDDAHWRKLDAFLRLYRASLPATAAGALTAGWHAWNGDGDMAAAWRQFEAALPALSAHAEHWCEQLAERGNLAAALVQFCANHV